MALAGTNTANDSKRKAPKLWREHYPSTEKFVPEHVFIADYISIRKLFKTYQKLTFGY